LANNYKAFETQVTGSFTTKDWTSFISKNLTKYYKEPAEGEKKKMSDIFSVYKKSTNNSKLKELIDFKFTPLKEGLRKTIDFFVDKYENERNSLRL
jgi:cytoplasmic iron level regulating protein YaaA (DUF328/UPF0246 family)